jgi:di/tricarboxylate transporter
MLTCFQTSVITSAMFLTAMAANPLSVNLAMGAIGQAITWTDWAVAAVVPGLVSLLVIPALLYVIYPPEVKGSPDAPRLAQENLVKMGPMTKNEKIMAVTLVATVREFGIFIAISWSLDGCVLGMQSGVVRGRVIFNNFVVMCDFDIYEYFREVDLRCRFSGWECGGLSVGCMRIRCSVLCIERLW